MFKEWIFNEMAQYNIDQLKQMGYEFRIENNLPESFVILVYKDKQWLAEAFFSQSEEYGKPHWEDQWDDNKHKLKPNQMWINNLWVDPNHRRMGIASAMYALAEKITKNRIIRTPSTTEDSDALWKQANRPFG